jgi:glutathione synthase/RimK-type ligase-like ATP-grasp enzyme
VRIAFITCERPVARDDDLDFVVPALRRRGVEVEVVAWTKPGVDWNEFDLMVLSSTWDYHRREPEFREWVSRRNRGGLLRNRGEVVAWNTDKDYLRTLEVAGVPTIPTIWTEPGAEDGIERTVAELGWSDVIVKPRVDLGAERLARVETAMVGRILRALDAPGMAQPFLSSVETVGELSLVFIGGELSHAVRKAPGRGDFRVGSQYGGTQQRIEPPAAALDLANAALAAAPGNLLYARVDLIFDDERRPLLVELELIEPNLFLGLAPGAGETFARAILAEI